MKRFGAVLLCSLMGLAAASAGYADTPLWGDIATISPTSPQVANRLCYSDGLDIACNTTAPYVSPTGNVGIGTTGPSNLLTLEKNNDGIRIQAASNPSYYTELINNYNALEPFYLLVGGRKIIGTKELASSSIYTETYINSGYALALTTGSDNNPSESNIRLFITKTGNVGIGTITPTATLEVSGTISATALYVTGTTGTVSSTFMYGNVASFTTLTVGGQTVTGGATGVQDRISSTGSTAVAVARPEGTISLTTGSVAGTAYFDTSGRLIAPGISVTTNQLSATTAYFSGNVGVGTANPGYKLDVTGSVRATGDASNVSYWVGNNQAIRNGVNGGTNYLDLGTIVMRGGDANDGQAKLRVSGGLSVGNAFTAATLSDGSLLVSGNVGIGTTNPTANLEVSGTISATNILVNGVAVGTPDRITSGTVSVIAQQAKNAVQVSGSVNVSGTIAAGGIVVAGDGSCAGNHGSVRINPATGRLQMCLDRP